MSEAIKTTEAEGDDEESPAAEFQTLYQETEKEKARIMKLATALKAEGKPELAAVYGEVAGTVMTLLLEVIAVSGGAIDAIDESLAELEEAGGAEGSQLLPEHAEKYITFCQVVIALCTELRKQASGEGTEQLDKIVHGAEELITLTRALTLEDETDEDEDEDEDEDDEEKPKAAN
jgi:hypothetical protein